MLCAVADRALDSDSFGLPHRRFIKRMKKHYGKSDKDAQELRSEYDLP